MKRNRIITLLLAFILLLSCGLSSVVMADERAELEQQNQEVQQKAEEAKEKADEAEESKATYEETKLVLDQQMIDAAAKVEALDNQVAALQTQIDDKEAEILHLTEDEDKNRELFKLRMRALYEENTASYLDVLLSSSSLSDLFYRMDVVEQVAAFDQKVITDIVGRKSLVEAAKVVLGEKEGELQVVKTAADTEKANLQTLIDENATMIAQLEADIESYTAEYEKFETESASIQAQIAAIAAAEREAAEKAKAEAEAAQQSESSDTSSGDSSGSSSSDSSSGSSSSTSGSGMTWPAPGYPTVTSYFGSRFHPVLKVQKLHTGIDIGAPSGASVVAADSGTVIISGYSGAYGNYIVINHGGGISTLYGHHSSNVVSKGAVVKKGQKIANVGSTGWSTGPHLHFEVQVNGAVQNPLNYVSP